MTYRFSEKPLNTCNGNIMPVWECQVISSASLSTADMCIWFLNYNDLDRFAVGERSDLMGLESDLFKVKKCPSSIVHGDVM